LAILSVLIRFWSVRVDALERYLDRMAQSSSEEEDKEKTTRTKPRT